MDARRIGVQKAWVNSYSSTLVSMENNADKGKKKEVGLNKFPHMLCKTALLINETELSLITMRLSVVYNNKKCPTVLAHQVGAIVLPTQIVIKK